MNEGFGKHFYKKGSSVSEPADSEIENHPCSSPSQDSIPIVIMLLERGPSAKESLRSGAYA